jgi:O-antigen ligase
MMTPAWRNRIVTVTAAMFAVWFGYAVAQGDSLPAVCAAALGVFIITRGLKLHLDTLLLGALLFGYVVGNRGFAQITLTSQLPILPAEAVLVVAGGLLCVQCAWRHELPFRREPLNIAILLWIIVGMLRIAFDVRTYGFLAVRDFAMVYYAAFFYLAQESGRVPASRRFLQGALLAGCALLLPLSEIDSRFPDFFLNTFTLRGIPLIYYKGDLLGTFLAVGAVLFFVRFETGGRWWNVVASLLLAGGVILSNNRASMLGLGLATAWLLVGGHWRFAAVQAGAGVIATALILVGAMALNISWQKTPVYGLYERTLSMVDFNGERTYSSNDSLNKGDNNTFRRVWWQTVIDETIEGNPYVGLGFGHDLAGRFIQEYYADSTQEFNTRSPHNILLTVFARMGAVGLVTFLIPIGIIAVRTWRTVRAGPREGMLWCCVWAIFASACLGVVLEGPMGAVVFWTILGLANAEYLAAKDDADAPADLHPSSATAQVPAKP